MKNKHLLVLAFANGFNGFCSIDRGDIVLSVISFVAMILCIVTFFKFYYNED